MGGPSAEREVSLSSGRECAQALRVAGYEVVEIILGADQGATLPARLADARADVVFNALHGKMGEDGRVQGLMDWMGVRYTHSGVLASALAMDKTRAKQVFRDAGLPVVESRIATAAEVRARHVMPAPYVVKPNDEGSSVGVYIVRGENNGPPQLSEDMPEQVMVETYAPGRELTTAVLGDRALGGGRSGGGHRAGAPVGVASRLPGNHLHCRPDGPGHRSPARRRRAEPDS